jgi:hypothetical protein
MITSASDQTATLAPPYSITSSARSSNDGGSQADRLRGLHIGYELKLGRLNERNIGGLSACEKASDLACCHAKCLRQIACARAADL